MSIFKITDLCVAASQKEILKGVNLTLNSGKIDVVMGPNGSGKSTLAHTIAGHPSLEVTGGSVFFDKTDILKLSPDQRAVLGVFLAFQYPAQVEGVRIYNFLKAAYDARFAREPKKLFSSVLEFRKSVDVLAQDLGIKHELLSRNLNDGFSGGEKKRLEILQMAVLEARFAILDETDSGLDVDAIRDVARGVQKLVDKHHTGVLLITHYERILKYLVPDRVHVMSSGKIVESGGLELVKRLEARGYEDHKPRKK